MVLWGHLLSATWPLLSPYVQMKGNRIIGWNGCVNIFCYLKRIGQFWSHSASWHWPCTCWVLSASPSYTSPVIGGVHLVQLQVLPCKLAPPPPGFLHQGILKGSAWRDVQGPTQPSLVGVLMSTSDAPSYAWRLHYGADIPTWTGPILASGQWSIPSALCVVHHRNNWPQRIWSATLFEHPVLWA